jgi:2-keto-4-pentenoate hydratase/2-oxohepta-3-ene-1,7-dioic acid hydratase in catechol pathway
MRFARVRTPDGIVAGEYKDGAVEGGDKIYEVGFNAKLLAPTQASTMYCVGRNYAETLDQMDYDRPEKPDFFIKPPASIHPPNTPVIYPSFSEKLTYAGELAAVVGEQCKNVSEKDVDDVLHGYTIMNDLDALDQHSRTARKAFNSSGPLGPWIETDIDPVGIDMHTEINGEERQCANTELMLFEPQTIISFISKRFKLAQGDVIAFGSPANPGLVNPGDKISITYDGIGTLRNTITEISTE